MSGPARKEVAQKVDVAESLVGVSTAAMLAPPYGLVNAMRRTSYAGCSNSGLGLDARG